MRLRVFLPTEVLVDQEVDKVVAEGQNGSFALLPRHVDFVSALVPGVLTFETPTGQEGFLAVNDGILVKVGPDVLVSTRRAVRSDDLESLRATVADEFRVLSEREQTARSALARLEAGFVRRFIELGEHGYG